MSRTLRRKELFTDRDAPCLQSTTFLVLLQNQNEAMSQSVAFFAPSPLCSTLCLRLRGFRGRATQ